MAAKRLEEEAAAEKAKADAALAAAGSSSSDDDDDDSDSDGGNKAAASSAKKAAPATKLPSALELLETTEAPAFLSVPAGNKAEFNVPPMRVAERVASR